MARQEATALFGQEKDQSLASISIILNKHLATSLYIKQLECNSLDEIVSFTVPMNPCSV